MSADAPGTGPERSGAPGLVPITMTSLMTECWLRAFSAVGLLRALTSPATRTADPALRAYYTARLAQLVGIAPYA